MRIHNGEAFDALSLPDRHLDVLVILLTFNHGTFIDKAINSVLSQVEIENWAVLIFDDASTDETSDIIDEFVSKHPERLFLARPKVNSYSRNRQIWMELLGDLQFEFLAFLEGDDYWIDNRRIADVKDLFEKHPKVSLVHTDFVTVNEGGDECTPGALERISARIKRFGLSNSFQTCTLIVRGNLIDKAVQSRASRFGIGDLFISQRYLRNGTALYLAKKTAAYRKHNGGVWTSRPVASQFSLLIRSTLSMFSAPQSFRVSRLLPLLAAQITGWLISMGKELIPKTRD